MDVLNFLVFLHVQLKELCIKTHTKKSVINSYAVLALALAFIII